MSLKLGPRGGRIAAFAVAFVLVGTQLVLAEGWGQHVVTDDHYCCVRYHQPDGSTTEWDCVYMISPQALCDAIGKFNAEGFAYYYRADVTM